jgi:putative hydrolase
MKTSGPHGASRSTTTVEAGRGFAGTVADTTHNITAMGRAPSGMDVNSAIAGLLRDLASVQSSTQKRWGYKRAATTIINLDQPIESFLKRDGTLTKIPNIGPSSERIILEVLRTGDSPTVAKAIEESGKTKEVEKSRGLRGHYLSRSQVTAALKNPRLDAVRREDYHGDLQMHSVWSDGSQTLADIVAAGIELGYAFSAITDHSYGLPIAGGVSMAKLAEQHREIDALNKGHRKHFRLLKGIEANIRGDGSIDMEPQELAQLEVVVAAPHSTLRSTGDQTARMLAAVKAPGIHILGHPRGRMFGARPGVHADWPRVFEAAAAHGVAIEIDGDPARQDVDYTLAREALAAGCIFALDSDAHSTRELRYVDTSIAHARLAGIPKERVVNCWPLDQLLEWLTLRTETAR